MKKRFVAVIASVMCFLVLAVGVAAQQTDEADGYIVTLKKPDEANFNTAFLFSEGTESEDMSLSQTVEYLDKTIDSATSLAPEMGIMKIDDEQTLDELVSLGLVEKAEPNIKLYLLGHDYEANPVFENQWGHRAIKSQFAWQAGVFGSGAKVGVIDSGVYPHKDLQANLLPGYNYVANNTDTTDYAGHGTFVAGIIAAQCNDVATVGLAHKAKIVPLKVTDNSDVNLDRVIRAINDAVDVYDCDVLNMSFGTTINSDALRSAVSYAVTNGLIVVAAAGNGKPNQDENGNALPTDYTCYIYPGAIDFVTCVSNLTRTGSTYAVSSTSTHHDEVDIAAPGTGVYALNISDEGTRSWSGTSFSCPYVAAAAALVKGLVPDWNQAQFNTVLKRSADSSYISASQGAEYWGNGLLDIKAMMKYVFKQMRVGDYYLSSEDRSYDGSVSVYLTNLAKTDGIIGSAVLYAGSFGADSFYPLSKIRTVPLNLDIDQSAEINFAGFESGSEVRFTVLSDKMKPLFNPVKSINLND